MATVPLVWVTVVTIVLSVLFLLVIATFVPFLAPIIFILGMFTGFFGGIGCLFSIGKTFTLEIEG